GREGGRLALRHERRRDHPGERHEGSDGEGEERRVDRRRGGEAGEPPPHARRPNSWSWSRVAIRMTAKSAKAIAAPYPKFHQRKPSRYIRNATDSVLPSGPPSGVMT